MIQVKHVSKSFRNREVLRDISFEVRTGEIVGLLGPNGAGKTTTMRILAGFFPPTSGQLLLNGTDFWADGVKSRAQIGYLPENVPLYDNLTAEEFLRMVSELKNIPSRDRNQAVNSVIKQCDLSSVRERLMGKLSKGFKQRIGLAQALIGSPSILILDEPTSGLDPKQISEVRALIRELARQKTVILSTHILPEASMLCSRVLMIHQGKIAASGTADELALRLRQSAEILVSIRGKNYKIESQFSQIPGIIAVRREKSGQNEHEYRIRYRKEKDVRPAISRSVLECGLELLELRESPMSLEEIFLNLTLEENA